MDDLLSITQAISRLELLSKQHQTAEGFKQTPPARQVQTVQAVEKKNSYVQSSPPKPVISEGQGEKTFETKWHHFVAEISSLNQSIGVYLEHGRPQGESEICFEHRFYKDRVLEVIDEDWFRLVLQKTFGPKNTIKWTFNESPKTASISIREAREMEQKKLQDQIEASARNHPVIKKALALFGGEIKAVKQVTNKGKNDSPSDKNS